MQTKSRTPLYLVIGLAVLALLAGAAFLGGRLVSQKANPDQGAQTIGGPGMIIGSGAGGAPGAGSGDMVTMEIKVKPAPELPQTPPEINGLFTKRDDNSIFIGAMSGGMGMGVTTSKSSEDGGAEVITSGPSFDGPVVEVVVTSDTKLYRETTQLDPSQPPSGEIQQTVEPGSLDDLGSDSMVIVWGRRTGDRVIADVMLYTQPMIIMSPKK